VIPGITEGLSELIDGGGVEKYASLGFWERLWGDMGPPFIKSWKPWFPRSMANGLGVIKGGAIMDCCHIDAEDVAGLLDPSSMTSLIPLWLAVLIADGDDPSIAFSLPS